MRLLDDRVVARVALDVGQREADRTRAALGRRPAGQALRGLLGCERGKRALVDRCTVHDAQAREDRAVLVVERHVVVGVILRVHVHHAARCDMERSEAQLARGREVELLVADVPADELLPCGGKRRRRLVEVVAGLDLLAPDRGRVSLVVVEAIRREGGARDRRAVGGELDHVDREAIDLDLGRRGGLLDRKGLRLARATVDVEDLRLEAGAGNLGRLEAHVDLCPLGRLDLGAIRIEHLDVEGIGGGNLLARVANLVCGIRGPAFVLGRDLPCVELRAIGEDALGRSHGDRHAVKGRLLREGRALLVRRLRAFGLGLGRLGLGLSDLGVWGRRGGSGRVGRRLGLRGRSGALLLGGGAVRLGLVVDVLLRGRTCVRRQPRLLGHLGKRRGGDAAERHGDRQGHRQRRLREKACPRTVVRLCHRRTSFICEPLMRGVFQHACLATPLGMTVISYRYDDSHIINLSVFAGQAGFSVDVGTIVGERGLCSNMKKGPGRSDLVPRCSVVSRVGVEPTTLGLKVPCSAN